MLIRPGGREVPNRLDGCVRTQGEVGYGQTEAHAAGRAGTAGDG